MTIHSSLLNSMPELVAIRRDLHAHPELGLEEVRTSEIVARELASYGYTVTRGLAKTGLVATLTNGTSRRSVGTKEQTPTSATLSGRWKNRMRCRAARAVSVIRPGWNLACSAQM